MKQFLKRNLLIIGCILGFSILAQACLFNQNSIQNIQKQEGILPAKPAGTEWFSKYPDVDKNYFSPYSSPGFMDEIELSFRPQYDVNYTCNVTAMPRSLNIPGADFIKLLYFNQTNKLGLIFQKIDYALPYFNISLNWVISDDNGTTWSNFRNITNIVQALEGFEHENVYNALSAVVLDDVIHCIYRFNQSELFYMNSSNEGLIWSTPRCIQNRTIPYTTQYELKFGMAVDPTTNTMYVVSPSGDDKYNSGTGLYYFFSSDYGTTWSIPAQLPITGSVDYQKCTLFFNSTGAALISVLNFTDEWTWYSYIIEMPNGLLGSGVFHQIGGYRSEFSMCIDLNTDKLTYIHASDDYEAYYEMWKCSSSNPMDPSFYSPITDKSGFIFQDDMIAINDTIFFVSKSDYSGISSIVFEHVSQNRSILPNSLDLPRNNDDVLIFNAMKNGIKVPYTIFNINFKAYNWTDFFPDPYYKFTTYLYRDDFAPAYDGPNYNQYISPQVIDNNFDSLNYNFTISEDAEYSYKILSNTTSPFYESIVSASLTVKERPRIIMDESGRFYCFYSVVSGGNYQTFVQVSETGGLTWSEPHALTMSGYQNKFYTIHYDHTSIYVITGYEPVYTVALLKSSDGGVTWSKSEMNGSVDPDYTTITREGIFYTIMKVDSDTKDAIFRSTDAGKTWENLFTFDHVFHSKSAFYVDDINQQYYFLNQTGEELEWVSFDLVTNQISTHYIAESNFNLNRWRWGGYDLRLTYANASNGNTTIQFQAYTNAWVSLGYAYGIEIWSSNDNGTSWLCTTNTSFSLTTPPIEHFFWGLDSQTHLHLLVENREGVDTVIIEGESRMVYRNTERTTRNTLETIDYRGINFNQKFLAQGEYQIELVILDQAENRNITVKTFFIDNTPPSIYNITWMHIPIDPLPKYSANVTFNINDLEGHLVGVQLYYRHSTTSWMPAPILHQGGTYYSVEIPGNLASTRLEFYIQATDLAGNIGTNDNNQSYFGWDDPVIEFVVLALTEDRSTYDELPLRVIFTKNAEAIANVIIVTDFGKNVTMTYIDNAFQGKVPRVFNKDRFSYQVYYQDKWGRLGVCYQGTHTRPSINIATVTVPDQTSGFTTNDNITFSIRFDEISLRYIQAVKVKYQIDNGEWQESTLTNASGLFTGEIGPFNIAENLSFYLVYVDIGGSETLIKESETSFTLIPAMPIVELDAQDSLTLALISAIVGMVIGVGYATALRTQQRDPFLTYNDACKSSLNERNNGAKGDANVGTSYILNDPVMQFHPKSQSKITLMVVVGLGALAAYGLYYAISIQFYEMATIIAVIIFLIVVLLFNIIMERSSDKASRNKKDYGKVVFLGFLFLIVIFGALALIFWVGSYIKWFNYYVYEERTMIGPIALPTLWLSVASTYFTSMLYVVITTLSSIKKLWIQLQEYTQNGSTLLDVFLFREKEIHSIKQQIIYKTLAFIVLVSVAVITATNLSTYINLGLLALLPFIITSILMILIFGKKGQTKTKGVTVQSIVKCPSCNSSVTNGTFCNFCGKSLVLEITEKVMKVKCPNCDANNEDGSYFCHICGTPLQNKPKS